MFETLGVFYRGLVLGLMIAAPVGPVGLLCIRRTIQKGLVIGFATGFGAAVADALCGAVAALGIGAILEFMHHYDVFIRILGGGFLAGWAHGILGMTTPSRRAELGALVKRSSRADPTGAKSHPLSPENLLLSAIKNLPRQLRDHAHQPRHDLRGAGGGGDLRPYRKPPRSRHPAWPAFFAGSTLWWSAFERRRAGAQSFHRRAYRPYEPRDSRHSRGLACGPSAAAFEGLLHHHGAIL